MENFDIDILIGQNLRRLREERRLSQNDLAEKIGVRSSRISAIEHGREGMGKYLMTRICKTLDVPPYVFYSSPMTDKTGTEDDQAQRVLALIREARALGLMDDLQEYAEYLIQKAIKDQKAREKEKSRKAG